MFKTILFPLSSNMQRVRNAFERVSGGKTAEAPNRKMKPNSLFD